jgi:hypothetical protein
MKTPITITLLTAMLVLGLAGCGSNEPRKEITTVSVGQQLIDLQKAFDSGAISKMNTNACGCASCGVIDTIVETPLADVETSLANPNRDQG